MLSSEDKIGLLRDVYSKIHERGGVPGGLLVTLTDAIIFDKHRSVSTKTWARVTARQLRRDEKLWSMLGIYFKW